MTTVASKKYILFLVVRTIQHQLQKDLKMSARCAAKKVMLTKTWRKNCLISVPNIKIGHQSIGRRWCCGESTFSLVKDGSKIVCRPSDVSRYDLCFTVQTVKHPDSMMVWDTVSGNKGRDGPWKASYINVLREHMLEFWDIHQLKFLSNNEISVLDWPRLKPNRKWLECNEAQAGEITTHQYPRPEGGAEEAPDHYGQHLLCQSCLIDARKDQDGNQEWGEHD